jgi:hypothetical protein
MVRHGVSSSKGEDEDSKPVNASCCAKLSTFEPQTVIERKEEKEYDDGFGCRVWKLEGTTCGRSDAWSYKVADAMPALLTRHNALVSDWNEFLDEIHAINMSPWLKIFKMAQAPFLIILTLTAAPLAFASKGCGRTSLSTCRNINSALIACLVVFGIPSIFIYWLMSCFRREYLQQLVAVEEKYKSKFNADNDNKAPKFVFKLHMYSIPRTFQGRAYLFNIQEKTRGGHAHAQTSENPMTGGPAQGQEPPHKHGKKKNHVPAASAGKDVEMGSMD